MGRAGVGTFVKNMGSEKTPPLHELVHSRGEEFRDTNSSGFVSLSLESRGDGRSLGAPVGRSNGYNQGQMKRRVPPPSKRAELRATLTAIATRRPPGEPAVRLGVSLE